MHLQTRNKSMNKLATLIVGVVFALLLLAAMSVTAHAAPQHGFGQGQGRTDTVNEQDFHTNSWERFNFNYQFTSGSDHRFELGRPTTWSGFVPVDVFSVNMRRDANVSLRPPSYGIFSAQLPTPPANHLFAQPVNPHFHQGFQLNDPNLSPRHDTLQHGVNAQPIGNPMNIHTTGAPAITSGSSDSGGFLPPTSVLPPAGGR